MSLLPFGTPLSPPLKALGRWYRNDLAGIGITNQRETAVIWDRETGDAIHNAIVWQCRRTAGVCETAQGGHGPLIRERTGLVIDAYFSGTKAAWLLDNVLLAASDPR